MPNLVGPPSLSPQARSQPSAIPDVPGAAPTGSLPRTRSRTPKERVLEQLSYLSGRLAGLSGTVRYELPIALRDELSALAHIAEYAHMQLEGGE